MDDEEQPKAFQVKDRRRFTESGDVRENAPDAPTEDKAGDAPVDATEGQPDADRAGAAGSTGSSPRAPELGDQSAEITLSTFLMSLSTQALICLGEIPNPMTGESETDLTAVREFIDVISMLQEKTRGNLDPSESSLFDKILFDLRMRFVEKARK